MLVADGVAAGVVGGTSGVTEGVAGGVAVGPGNVAVEEADAPADGDPVLPLQAATMNPRTSGTMAA